MKKVIYEGKDLEAMSSATNYNRWILQKFAPFLKGSVMEVGAGSGTFTALLTEGPVTEVVAVEPSQEMYPLLAERFRGTAQVFCRQAFFPDISAQYQKHFDSVVYINVLEHIQNDKVELQHIYSSLKESGAVCIFVPALPFLFSEYDRSIGHYRRYTKKQLKNLLEKTGFEIISLHYFDSVGVIPWFLFIKLMKTSLVEGNVGLYDAIVVPIMSRLESLIPPPIGKNLIAVARKRR
jgi:SAM-dependent methyltransferase